MTKLITDLKKLPDLAEAYYDEFQVMRYMLQNDDDINDVALDTFVEEVAAPIIATIDCTDCGNCCMSLKVYLEAGDADRMAAGLNIPLSDIKTHYIDTSSTKP
ncbi:MAG: YkgJ family cysteine cluster protein, partial [Aggregatilineales bacterium]